MRCILSFLLTLSLSYICAQQGEFTQFQYPDGTVSSEGWLRDGKPDGFWRTYYPSGGLKSEGKRSDFQLDSVWAFYTKDSLLQERITYVDGKRQGKTWAYSQGLITSICDYEYDTLQGICTEYEANTAIREVPFVAGKQDGKGYSFGRNGEITAILYFKTGFLRRSEKINRLDKLGRKQGAWKTFYEDRSLKTEGSFLDGEKHGLFKTYSPAGDVLTMEKYLNGILDVGAAETTEVEIKSDYFSDGKIKATGSYLDGKKHGVHREYDTEGTIIASTIYEYGAEVARGIVGSTGRLEGPFKELYPNGEVKREGEYVNGLRSGKWKYYHENGALSQKGEYRKGKPHGAWRWYWQDGTTRREENYRNGREDGLSVEYNTAGEILSKGEYIDGLKEGEWYYHIGDHTITGSYKQGEKDGDWFGKYDNGKTQFKGAFNNGFAKGKHRYYFPSGQLKQDGKFSSGRRVGEWRIWDEQGDVILRSEFENGIERRLQGVKISPTYEELFRD